MRFSETFVGLADLVLLSAGLSQDMAQVVHATLLCNNKAWYPAVHVACSPTAGGFFYFQLRNPEEQKRQNPTGIA
ncbi:uncharacterized protein BO95DRAFT_139973 [Aspergillus brunneoviolaceus CBS 621.78]|uniref:Uncharacterized protein n=2 Tax=Aspergillus TaxID=5052 RepID=A0A8G1RDP1_9EURO|nr:hypothetical protein BO95DRAFT_139973 [Aspergillus brunneoviolaceus CBS 621.78]XP_040795021.1 uncharacterized protein BO72DRAFT_38004 [Aspergillus fijiensis CBS 313.89]RAH45402.1 hypothetical protein BO95DRAFT_139973 [Aspergillus brunneoviolaceus CBS 621.78]RAK71009.1 hypothetical protein BO72DRAFT_38004 [Aspergillus fijiensis CBS 313.89]